MNFMQGINNVSNSDLFFITEIISTIILVYIANKRRGARIGVWLTLGMVLGPFALLLIPYIGKEIPDEQK